MIENDGYNTIYDGKYFMRTPQDTAAVSLQDHGIDGILVTFVGDPPIPCVSILSTNVGKSDWLSDRARELLVLLRK